jgi:hypothetical protein
VRSLSSGMGVIEEEELRHEVHHSIVDSKSEPRRLQ